jgi:hypothetical protein
MGLLDWLKPKTRTQGPTPEGLCGALPRAARWVGEADPAGDPEDFIPGSEAYVFDIVKWRWDQTAVMCELLMLRGIVVPDEGRFTARMKVVFPAQNGWP